MKVKIYLMHLGENYNGSFFEQTVVEDAIPTLANTPILAYITINPLSNEKDFAGHEMEVVLDESTGNLKMHYKGVAVGVIPESNNAHFEDMVGSDGVNRKYLVVEGIVWNKFDEAQEILEREQVVNQSMELHSDYDGFFETGLFHFTKFSFYGACLLSNNVAPAMHDARVEVKFSKSEVFTEIAHKMEEFKIAFSRKLNENNNPEEGSNYNMADETNVNEEEVGTKLTEEQQILNEDTGNTHATTDTANATNNTTNNDTAVDNFENNEDTVTNNNPLDEQTNTEGTTLTNVDGEEATTTNNTDVDETVALEHGKLQTSYSQLMSKYKALENEVNQLRDFKRQSVLKEREAKEQDLFSQFTDVLSQDEVNAVKEQVGEDGTIEELEEKLFVAVGKKNFSLNGKKKVSSTFTGDTKENKIVIGMDNDTTDDTGKSYDYLFQKYQK
jgi:hypothetical protein